MRPKGIEPRPATDPKPILIPLCLSLALLAGCGAAGGDLPGPAPSRQMLPGYTQSLDVYRQNWYCEQDSPESRRPGLYLPQDLAVSRDGATVWIANARRVDAALDPGRTTVIPRAYIQQLREGKLGILTVKGQAPLSCHLDARIEADAAGALYLGDSVHHRLYRLQDETLSLAASVVDADIANPFYGGGWGSDPYTGWGGVWTPLPTRVRTLLGPEDVYVNAWEPAGPERVFFRMRRTGDWSWDRLRSLDLPLRDRRMDALAYAGYAVRERRVAFSHGNGLYRAPLHLVDGGRSAEVWAGGEAGFADGPALRARFRAPTALRWGPQGELYVADTGNHAIRRVSPDGQVSTLAGGSEAGLRDGKGSAARFDTPTALDLDAAGNLYIADTGNHAVRKITPTGQVTTLYAEPGSVGTPSPGPGQTGTQPPGAASSPLPAASSPLPLPAVSPAN